MVKFSKQIVKFHIPILVICALLLIPAVLGMAKTRINYDMLDYLPDNMDTVKGQDILLDEFGKGAFSLVMVEGMNSNEVSKLKAQLESVEHVETVLWYDSLMDLSIPIEVLPTKYYEAFNKGNTTMMAIFFDTSTSADKTMDAIANIRSIAGKQCFISGMSALVTDLKALCEKEEPIYVGLAVILACVTMMIFMDSWIIPFIFLTSIGMAILLNLGTNYFLGEVSYITKALSAVLQLGVTMDYSIFLWHSYTEEKSLCNGDKKIAMSQAITNTITAVIGSSVTTIAGFLALCFMTFTLGKDLGIVMAKGVVFGVIGCITTLPALILIFDKVIEKTKHRSILPKMDKVAYLITKHSWIFIVVFVAILIPAFYGYTNAKTYYDLGDALPKDMKYVIANTKLREDFDMASTHMILADSKMSSKNAQSMLNEIDGVDGIKYSLGFNTLLGSSVPEDILPDSLVNIFKSNKYQLILISSKYKVASDEVNAQVKDINSILKKYDPNGMLIGEAPCTRDLINITDKDFKVVNTISIIAIFLIIGIVLKSAVLPFILVSVIELAIFINLGIPCYTGLSLPFVAPICISTIQLGSTVDYAILMTTRYKKERFDGNEKHKSVTTALSTSIPSIVVSALGFFAATFGVSLYSDMDIISSMCNLMARGAIVSMLSVIFILPAFLMAFDKIICSTGIGFKNKSASLKINSKTQVSFNEKNKTTIEVNQS